MRSPLDTHHALLTRRTVAQFHTDPLPEAVLERALQAAHHAPNHRLTWPWRFLVLGPTTRAALADIAVRLKEVGGPLPPEVRESVRRSLLDPGALVFVARSVSADAVRTREDAAAVACAIQNLQLSLHADGFGCKWGTGALVFAPDTGALLGLDPTREAPEALLYLGRPKTLPNVVRPPFTDFVRRLP